MNVATKKEKKVPSRIVKVDEGLVHTNFAPTSLVMMKLSYAVRALTFHQIADSYKNDQDGYIFLDLHSVFNSMGISSRNYSYYWEHLRLLKTATIDRPIERNGKKYTEVVNPIDRFLLPEEGLDEIAERQGVELHPTLFALSYRQDCIKQLTDPAVFALIDLAAIAMCVNLKQVIMYQNLARYRSLKNGVILSIEEILNLIKPAFKKSSSKNPDFRYHSDSVVETYRDNFSKFNERVLKPILKHINGKTAGIRNTDIKVTIEKIKEGRKITAIKFFVKNDRQEILPSGEEGNKELLTLAKIYFSTVELKNYFINNTGFAKKYSTEQLLNALSQMRESLIEKDGAFYTPKGNKTKPIAYFQGVLKNLYPNVELKEQSTEEGGNVIPITRTASKVNFNIPYSQITFESAGLDSRIDLENFQKYFNPMLSEKRAKPEDYPDHIQKWTSGEREVFLQSLMNNSSSILNRLKDIQKG